MASRYGIDTDNWRYADNSPVTSGRGRQANMLNAGLAAYQAVRGFQADQADSEAADAAKNASTEYTERQNYNPEDVQRARAETDAITAQDAVTFGEGAPAQAAPAESRQRYGLGATGPMRDTQYTPAEKRTAGLQATADYWAGNNTVGAAGKAERAQDRLDLGLDRQRTRAREDKADEIQQFNFDEGKRKVGLTRAGDAALARIVPIGGYVAPDGTPAKKGAFGATPQTEYMFLQANAEARRVAGDYKEYGELSIRANKELNNETLRGINQANNVGDLNRGAYAQFNNGKDIVETRNPDKTVSFGHAGEPPMYTSNPKNVDRNPFQQFQDLLAAKINSNPEALPKLHASIARSQQEWAKIEMSDATKKQIEGLRADVRATSKKETRSETIDAVAISYADASAKAHNVETDGPLTDTVKARYLRDGYSRQLRAEKPAPEYAQGLGALPPASSTAAYAERAAIEALRSDAGSSSEARLAIAQREKAWENTYGVRYNSIGARSGPPLASGSGQATDVDALRQVAAAVAEKKRKDEAELAEREARAKLEQAGAAGRRNAATGTLNPPR